MTEFSAPSARPGTQAGALPAGALPGPPDELDPPPTSTPLSELRDELTAELEHLETFEVPGRPGYAVRFDVDVDHNRLGHWRKRAKDTTQPEGLDEVKWAASILASQAVAIVRHGADLELDGQPATFATPAFQELLGVGRPIDAVKALYGRHASVIATAWAVLEAAGYNRRPDEAEDPTTAS